MTRYSEELKQSVIAKMMPPENKTIGEIARETGIGEATLHQWRKKARSQGFATPADGQNSERWSTQDKFLIVVATASMNEAELSEYCRAHGLFAEQVQTWRDACMQANGGVAKEAGRYQQELRQEKKRVKDLEKELRRKESALAETAALLTLRKKAHAIWGDGEDA